MTRTTEHGMEARLRLRVDRDAPLPASAQIVGQIRRGVDAGHLGPGARLPTVRALAKRLDVVPNTVAKAYRMLESEGYVEGRGRAGTFVVDAPPIETSDPRAALQEAAEAYLRRARRLGFGTDEALLAVRRGVS